jgi:phosphatidate cytidylyltransferase
VFRQRLITAVLLTIGLLAAIVYLPHGGFSWLMVVVTLAAGWEWSQLTKWTSLYQRVLYLLGLVAALLMVSRMPVLGLYALPVWLLIAYLVLGYPRRAALLKPGIIAVLGLLVLPSLWVSVVACHYHYGVGFLLVLIATVAATDSVAYLVGRRWGRRKLLPLVSPAKTIEGLLAGVSAGMMVWVLGAVCLALPIPHWERYSVLGVGCVIAALFGDLFMSMLKRNCAIKDTGSLLPGHGGILDRIDSILAAGPLVYYGLWLGVV